MKRCPACSNVCLPSQAFCSACGESLSEAAQIIGDPYLGTVFGGRYRIVKKLGEGGMGAVYRAETLDVGQTVAVKLLHERFVGDATALKRFEREAQVASKLNHPNSIAILDFGTTASGASYLVMEYLKGVSLSTVLHREALSVGQSIFIIRQVLSVLEAAHALSIVHRDLKPANIFLIDRGCGENHVKVLDFGIARLRREGGIRVTRTGMVCGTPEYMSPEQARGFELDARSDLYSAGVVLYEMLTGKRPFEGKSPAEIMSAHISDDAVVPSKRAPEREIPPSLDAIVMWALSKPAEDRLPSAVEFLRVVDTWAMVTEPDQSTPVLLRCPGCKAGYLPGSEHCPECGIALERLTGENESVEISPPSSVPPDDTASGQVPGPPPISVELPGTRELDALAAKTVDSAWFEIPMPATVPLVGYHDLLEELERELVQPGIHLARFVGTPGVGRRRLATTLIGRLASEGRRGIHVQPDPHATPDALGAIQRATTQLLQLPCEPMSVEDLREAVSSHGLTGSYVAGLADLYNLAKPDGLGIDERRVLRAEAWRELVIAASRKRPTALFFEDFDRLDGASRELVQALSAVDTDASLTLIISHRPELVALWTPGFREVSVQGLSQVDAEELALELCDGELEDDELAWLAECSGGNPLHLIQLIAFYRNNQNTDPPRAMADLIATRMALMPLELRVALQAAAVAGEVLSTKALGKICEMEDSIDQAVVALVTRMFLVSSPAGHRFIHPYVRQVVYSAIPAGIRREIHSRVARHLARIDSSPALLAHHLWYSERAPEEILPHLVSAGEWALSVMDEESASIVFSRALKLLPSPAPDVTDPGLRAAWIRTIFGLTSTLARSGNREEARHLLDWAREHASGAGWHVEAARLEVTSAL